MEFCNTYFQIYKHGGNHLKQKDVPTTKETRYLLLGLMMLMVCWGSAFGQTAVLRTWFSANRGDHFTTTDPGWAGIVGDVRMAGPGGYTMIREEGRIYDPGLPMPAGTVPLYSFWNAEREDNFITSNPEWVSLAAHQGYRRFRLEGYIAATQRPGFLPLTSLWSAGRLDNYASSDPRIALPPGSEAGERTMSVEGGRYGIYRVEGFIAPPTRVVPSISRPTLRGLIDMHAHPMSHLGFGKKLMHGVPDSGSLLPAGTRDCNGTDRRARSAAEALGHCNSTHGVHGAFDNTCGNHIRNKVLNIFETENSAQSSHGPDVGGYPSFAKWPRWNDITHQQMWVEWIRRSHQNGMRVMVALAVNNRTIGHVLQGDGPMDDRSAGDLQIREIRSFVSRHSDFMEVALSHVDLRRIVAAGRLAIVLGVELDDLGNFNSMPAEAVTTRAIEAEITRLRGLGVRYVLPIHLQNNRFGGSAVYEEFFNALNRVQSSSWMGLECSPTVGWRHGTNMTDVLSALSLDRPSIPSCPSGQGHRNIMGLTAAGRELIGSLMRNGMLLDIDHMSEKSADEAISAARAFPGGWGYPIVSGHNGPRALGASERQLRPDQLEAVRDMGGMLGLGWGGATPAEFRANLAAARNLMGHGRVGFGTDLNGLEKQIKPPGTETRVTRTWTTGSRRWDFANDGVANYGMIPELVEDIGHNDTQLVASLFSAAESFARVWERAAMASSSARRASLAEPPTPATERSFTPVSGNWFCPSQVLAGDREFDGHGPEIWASAELEIRTDGAVEAVITMRAKETQHDWSETRGTWRVVVSPPGVRVREILSDRRSETHVLSSAAGFQIIGPGPVPNAHTPLAPITGGNLVRNFEIIGDTGGPDISHDNDCNDDTRIHLVFNDVRYTPILP